MHYFCKRSCLATLVVVVEVTTASWIRYSRKKRDWPGMARQAETSAADARHLSYEVINSENNSLFMGRCPQESNAVQKGKEYNN